jgi:DNA modification methylase
MKDLLKTVKNLKAISYNKEFNKVSKIHKYWSRKPWHIIEDYIRNYTKPYDTVLDAFCGSGSVGLECALNNRKFIGYDLNPIAIHLTENTLSFDFDTSKFYQELNQLEIDLKARVMKLYQVADNRYVLYSILGKNDKSYDTVVSDYDFKHKSNENFDDKELDFSFEIPEDFSFPDSDFPEKFYKDRFSYKGIRKVSDMFSKRNVYALTLVHDYIQTQNLRYKSLFMLAFTNTLLHVSKLKAENVRPLSVNNYWIPDDFIEENVIWRFLDRAQNIQIAKETILKRKRLNKINENAGYKLYNKSSLPLAEIEANSIDYLITDPPYGDAIQYSELSFIWNCWLQKAFENKEEVIINPVQSKGVGEFQNQIAEFIENAHRVLKPDAFFTLCFQNKELKIWLEIVQKIRDSGFVLHDIQIYDTFGSPYNKHWAKFSPKSDLYVTFKKSKQRRQVNREEVSLSDVANRVIELFNQHLEFEFDLYKIYDLFVATVIGEVFKGKIFSTSEKWDLKKIVEIFETKKQYGTRQKGSAGNFQAQLFL